MTFDDVDEYNQVLSTTIVEEYYRYKISKFFKIFLNIIQYLYFNFVFELFVFKFLFNEL